MKKKVLITTAIDYANEEIHIGHSYQKLLADCLARFYREKLGTENVYFLTGTDEHGSSSEKAAKARGISPKEHVDDISAKDKKQLDALAVSYNRFIRTTDEDHKKIASDFYKKSFEHGDIYKGSYQGFYCEGCEEYKTLTELNETQQCSLHPTRQIQLTQEDNYFFKWSAYADFLKELLQKPDFLLPEGKKKEMTAFVEQGLRDLPITRPKHKVSWGIDVFNDSDQVIYVWFDALINYYTAGVQNNFWDADTKIVHILGKDNTKWHAVLWPAMLKSAGLNLPDTIYSHGFINLEGNKISKSRGNVVRPNELVEKYGLDFVRYYFLRYGPIVEDVDISFEHMHTIYNADLANGLGNTVSRVAKLAEKSEIKFAISSTDNVWELKLWEPLENDFRVDLSLGLIWQKLAELDKHITENEPWKITDFAKLQEVLSIEVNELRLIAKLLKPYMPNVSKKISEQFDGEKIKASTGLFPRLA